MRNLIYLSLLVITVLAKAQTISISYNGGTNSITCLTQSINATASCVGFSTVSTFTWVSPVLTFTGSNVNINLPSTYTVMALNGNMWVVHTFTVFQNTVPPVSFISSTVITASGSAVPTVTMVAINPTTSIQHVVYSPGAGTLSTTNATMYYTPSGPGTYTHCLFWQVNGCSSCKTFTVYGGPTALVEYTTEQSIRVFQNTAGEICIKGTKPCQLGLYDLSGKSLSKFDLKEEEGFTTSINGFKPGLYILVSEFDKRKQKIIIGDP